MFHRCLGTGLAASPGNDSRLRYTFKLIPQRQVAVKLHGVFAFSWNLTDCAPSCRFHRLRRGDSRALVGPSCKSPIKRQGITLTSVTFMTSDLSEADHDFSGPPHVAMRVGLYLHSILSVRRTVSEDSRQSAWPFLLITCTQRIFTLMESSVGFSGVPAYGRILLRQRGHL